MLQQPAATSNGLEVVSVDDLLEGVFKFDCSEIAGFYKHLLAGYSHVGTLIAQLWVKPD